MEYTSQKTVTILERRLGLMHLFFFVLIMGYMVGVRLILEKGYQAVELSQGFVSARLEGTTYSVGSGQYFAVDAPGLTGPELESDALFVPTTVATTRGQRQDNCTDPAQPCSTDADCMRLPPLAYGLCEDGQCMQLGWCPRENVDVTQTTVLQVERAPICTPSAPHPRPLRPLSAPSPHQLTPRHRPRQNLRDLQLVLAADMHFPRLGSERLSTEDGRTVLGHPFATAPGPQPWS